VEGDGNHSMVEGEGAAVVISISIGFDFNWIQFKLEDG
jgi:hypothetical protein